jgi:ubiquinone/menaquinone biosynthesis C-methylase UbiE
MSATDATFAGSIPIIYEQYLGSLLFEPYAQDMAARLSDVTQGRILEVAAGTGIATRALAKALPPDVEIVATDLNQAMLDLAARRLQAPNVTWRQTDAQTLPFEDSSFDAVACQFGVMFFPDKLAAYREALRVLKPGGRFVFSVWNSRLELPRPQRGQPSRVRHGGAALSRRPSPLLRTRPLRLFRPRPDPRRGAAGRV